METQDQAANVYVFGCGPAERELVTPERAGNKGANLIRMSAAGLPVPPGFVLPTSICQDFLQAGGRFPEKFSELLSQSVKRLETSTGLTFGGEHRPLLLAVRSGAAVSMPGMMDTILNVGLCDRTLPALVRMTGNPRHAWDSYRRLIEAYAVAVDALPDIVFDRLLSACLEREGVPTVGELDVAALKDLTRDYLAKFEVLAGRPFPQDPLIQVSEAIAAVFRSWKSARAIEYRSLHHLDESAGTAVTVQAMVFGNMGGTSGAGVAFTRDPATGEKTLYMDFLWNSQGEDIVSGRRTVYESADFEQRAPGLYREVVQLSRQLEVLFRDVEDFEFTVQQGRLCLLQSRDAKRTANAALRIACDLVHEGLIDENEALARLAKYDLSSIRVVRPANADRLELLCKGIPASPGVAVGEITLDPASAAALATQGRTPILLRSDISPADITGLAAAAGLLTSRGGRTSHAAVVARHLNKVCIVGCPQLVIRNDPKECQVGNRWLREGAVLSLDGQTGNVYAGKLEMIAEAPTEWISEVERWKKARDQREPGLSANLREN